MLTVKYFTETQLIVSLMAAILKKMSKKRLEKVVLKRHSWTNTTNQVNW